MDAMEIHTIQVYPYRAGARSRQMFLEHHYPVDAMESTLSQSTLIGLVPGFANMHIHKSFLIGPGFANAHAYPPSLIQCHVDAMEIHTIQVYPYRAGARVCQHAYPQIFSAPLSHIGAVKGDKGAGKDGKGKGDKGKLKSGKGKGKKDEHHDWSKGKWKRDDKGKGKDHRGKGKGEDQGKGKTGEGKNEGKGAHVNNPDAGKQCYICKYGHIAKECWWKVSGVEAEGKGNASSSGDIPKSATGGSNAVGSIRESSYDPLAHHISNISSQFESQTWQQSLMRRLARLARRLRSLRKCSQVRRFPGTNRCEQRKAFVWCARQSLDSLPKAISRD